MTNHGRENDAAKIEAQKLHNEEAKECVPASSERFTGAVQENKENLNALSTEHLDKAIKDESAVISRTESEPRPEPVKVSRAKRRGLFGRFTLVAEVTEPKHYRNSTKWFLTFVIAMAAIAAPFGSTILFRKVHISKYPAID